MRFNVINLEVSPRIPEGFRLIEAYAKGNKIFIPIVEIPEKEEHLHNCDWEGCGTLDHVFSFSVESKYASHEADPTHEKDQ